MNRALTERDMTFIEHCIADARRKGMAARDRNVARDDLIDRPDTYQHLLMFTIVAATILIPAFIVSSRG